MRDYSAYERSYVWNGANLHPTLAFRAPCSISSVKAKETLVFLPFGGLKKPSAPPGFSPLRRLSPRPKRFLPANYLPH